MKRVSPKPELEGIPCSYVAVACALGGNPSNAEELFTSLKTDGYASLAVANRFIRSNLKIKKCINYKRGERPMLIDLHLDGRAVVCVLGHFLYLDHETYYSFFKNEYDDVVSVWIIKEEGI